MIRKDFLLIMLFVTAAVAVFAQKDYKYTLELSGDFKRQPDFNTENIVVQATVTHEYSEITVGLQLLNGKGTYNLYAFDAIALEGSNDSDWKNLFSIYKWARTKPFMTGVGVSKGKEDINFNGNFIEYNSGFLRRNAWEDEGGYKRIMDQVPDFDQFTVVNTIELPETSLHYVFLVTENGRNNESILGVTQPIEIPLGNPKEEQPKEKPVAEASQPVIPQPEEEPVEDVAQKWNNRIKNELLKPFLDKGIYSYEDIATDPLLKLDYEQGDYDNRIAQAMTEMEKELAGNTYRETRDELWSVLSSFRKTEEEKAKTMPKEEEQQIVEEVQPEQTIPKPQEAPEEQEKLFAETTTDAAPEEVKPQPVRSAGGSHCIDSVVHYYRRALKLSTAVLMTDQIGPADLSRYRLQFKQDSLKFKGFAAGCNSPSTIRYEQDFVRVAHQLNNKLYKTNHEAQPQLVNAGVGSTAAPVADNTTVRDKQQLPGNKWMRYLLIAIVAGMFLAMFGVIFLKRN